MATYHIFCRYETPIGSLQKRFDVSNLDKYCISGPLTILYLPEKTSVALYKSHRRQAHWKKGSPPKNTRPDSRAMLRKGLLIGIGAAFLIRMLE